MALRDAKKVKNGALASGNNRAGWLLTSSGFKWAQGAQRFLSSANSRTPILALRREDASELNGLRSHQAFREWQAQSNSVQYYQAADAVRLTADAPREVIAQRIDALSNKARLAGIAELQEYLLWLKTNVTKEPSKNPEKLRTRPRTRDGKRSYPGYP